MAAFLSRNKNNVVYGKTKEKKIVLVLRKLLTAIRTKEANKDAVAAKQEHPGNELRRRG